MKEFRKIEEGSFICEECGKTYNNKQSIRIHISKIHNSKQYFNKWLKENDAFCKICNKETKFIGLLRGYKNTCSSVCQYKMIGISSHNTLKEKDSDYQLNKLIKRIKTNKEKYGVENISQLDNVKDKKEKPCLKNFGVKAGFADVKKRNITNIKKYGVENYNNSEKTKNTNLFKYNVTCTLHTEKNIIKKKKTWVEKYGVENPSQNINILNKGFKTRFLIHQYKDTNLTYQGSYELDFIDRYFPLYPDIQNGPSIKYIFNGKNKVYHSDFYIPSLNLVIEIKSSWTLTQDVEIEAKKKATIANDFKYIMILDKDYNEFNIFLLSA